MNSRAFLMVALLASPAWSQEPPPETPAPAVKPLDLRSDAVKKIVHDTAASQYGNAQVAREAPADAERREVEYVPPEDLDEVPVREAAKQPPAPTPAPQPDGFLSSMFGLLIAEALGNDQDDAVTTSNEMLRCRIQKEQKSSPPGPDRCPLAD
jgi:hypothetical protein